MLGILADCPRQQQQQLRQQWPRKQPPIPSALAPLGGAPLLSTPPGFGLGLDFRQPSVAVRSLPHAPSHSPEAPICTAAGIRSACT